MVKKDAYMNQSQAYNALINGSRLIESNPEQAISLIKRGLVNLPQIGEGWFNLGLAYHQNKLIKEAIEAYKTALSCEEAPIAVIKNNLAQDLLLNGNYKEGWNMYEERLNKMGNTFDVYSNMYGKPWEGFDEKRNFDTIVVIAEQGFGDAIQFGRLVLWLQDKGFNVQFFCPEPLAKLFRTQTEIKNVCIGLSGATKNKLWCPLMSLPRLLSINSTNIPYANGYIKHDKEMKEKWRKLLQKDQSKKLIGIHWQGNPEFERRMYSKGRSINVKSMKYLAELKNCQFVSLQKGEHKRQREALNNIDFVPGQRIFDETLDFRITSGVIANCDYIISSDSSIVHLAGSMNVKTITALSYVPEWRWLTTGIKTNWYESMELYRQTKRDDWSGVFKNIVHELKHELLQGL